MRLEHRAMLYFFRPQPLRVPVVGAGRVFGASLFALVAVVAGCAADPVRTHEDDSQPALLADVHETRAADTASGEAAHAEVAHAEIAEGAATASHDAHAGTALQAHDPCRGPATPDPRDSQITTGDKAVIIQTPGGQDVGLPPQVLEWMKERQFAEAHDGWHLVRRWDQGCRKSNAPAQGCAAAQRLLNQGLWRADIQQGAPGDGLAFMMAHRHMIDMMKQTFPKHAGLFSSFKRIPKTKNDPENPMPWKNISWTQSNLRGFEILENIEKNLDMFPNEDELGHFIQGSIRWTPERPSVIVSKPGSGLHGALHGQWSVVGSPIALINQAVDVRNFTFWKLHGWIDDIWERYRVAKGMKQTDSDYQKIYYEQCTEMHALEPRNRNGVKPPTGMPPTSTPDTAANGFFAKNVRPIFDARCTGCHSALGGAAAGLVLGGTGVTTAEIIEGILNVPSTNGEFPLVVPRDPDKSWLFLKASGNSERVTCSVECDRQRMPPAGAALTAAQIATLRQWITNGATAQ